MDNYILNVEAVEVVVDIKCSVQLEKTFYFIKRYETKICKVHYLPGITQQKKSIEVTPFAEKFHLRTVQAICVIAASRVRRIYVEYDVIPITYYLEIEKRIFSYDI